MISSRTDARRRGQCRCFAYVYVIRRGDGLYKIGMTGILRERLVAISANLASVITVVSVVPSTDAAGLERRLHRLFRERRARGEWFALGEDQLEGIMRVADDEACPEHTGWCAQDAPPVTNGEIVDAFFTGTGEWLPPSQAASRLGMSERTLWRRIDAGKFQKRVIQGRAQVYVPMAGSAPAMTGEAPVPPDGQDRQMAVKSDSLAIAVIQELRRRADEDAAARSDLQERLTRQAEEIGKLKAELKAAQARVDDLSRPAWWQFWR